MSQVKKTITHLEDLGLKTDFKTFMKKILVYILRVSKQAVLLAIYEHLLHQCEN